MTCPSQRGEIKYQRADFANAPRCVFGGKRLALKVEGLTLKVISHAKSGGRRKTLKVEGRISLAVNAGAGGVAVARDGGRRGG